MTYKIRVVAIADNGQEQVHDLPCLQRTDLTPETISLSLAESQAILRDIQQRIREHVCQVTERLEEELGDEQICFIEGFRGTGASCRSPMVH